MIGAVLGTRRGGAMPVDLSLGRRYPYAAFVLRRVISGVFVVFVVLCLIFFLGHGLGDPARLLASPVATPAEVAALRHKYGLDQALMTQFYNSIGMWVRGDFGKSIWQGVPALPLALQKFPITLYLAGVSILIAVVGGVLVGGFAGLFPGSIVDKLLSVLAALSISVAPFWLGLMLILLFAVHLEVFPASGFGGLSYVLLPAVTLSLASLGRLGQVARSAVVSERSQLYVTAARSRGVPEPVILMREILRNAAVPVLTMMGTELVSMVDGAVVIESLFTWPGIGLLLIDAINRSDLPLVEACVFLIASAIVVLNIIIDIVYTFLDPRVRLQET